MRGSLSAMMLGLALLGGCGPDDVVDAELEEVCGEPGPFRLLELDEDEAHGGIASRIGERLYFVVGDAVDESDAPFDDNSIRLEHALAGEPTRDVDRCVRRVAEGRRRRCAHGVRGSALAWRAARRR